MGRKKGTAAQGKKQQFQQNESRCVYPIEKFKIEDQLLDQVEELLSYYRQFPHLFVEDYLGITLKDYQKIVLYEMVHNKYFVFTGSRSIAKTFMTAICAITVAVLFPRSKIVITAMEKQQIAESFTKILEIMKVSPMASEEISDCSDTVTSMRCLFWNGSTIRPATMSEGSRHYRANFVIVDEYVTYDNDILQKVITAFLSLPRRPAYLDLPEYQTKEYEYLIEPNKQVYLSSVGHKSSWAYKLLEDAFKQMIYGKEGYFVCALSYRTAVKSGLIRKDTYVQEMSKSTTDKQVFDAEYMSIWMSDSENGYYKYDMLENCRTLKRAEYLTNLQQFVAEKDNRYVKKRLKKDEQSNEIILVGADIASVGGKRNDLSAYCVLRLIEKKKVRKKFIDGREVSTVFKYYDRELIHMETHEGMLVKNQTERLKRLFYEYGASYLVVDAMNCGSSVLQLLSEPTDCSETGEEYSPMMSIYDDEYALICQYSYAKKCIVPITAGAQSNHDMADKLLGNIAQGRVKLLIEDKGKAKDYLYGIKGFDDEAVFNKDIKDRMFLPYKETTALINEMIALEKVPTSNNLIKLKEPVGRRKDRYSAFLYANGFADKLESELIASSASYDDDDDVVDIYVW